MSVSHHEAAQATPKSNVRGVVVRGSGAGFAQEISAGQHRLRSDEPASAGGTDTGPAPYDLLLAALGSCTSITLGMYARRKGWPLEDVTVNLRHSKVHASDCVDCESKDVMLNRIERDLQNYLRFHFAIPSVVNDRVLFEMLSQLCDLHVGQTAVSLADRQQLAIHFVADREGIIAQDVVSFTVTKFRADDHDVERREFFL